MRTVLGIDLGTQHLKVLFYDFENREIIASESAALDLYQGEQGEAEQHAHWWTNALRKSLQKVGREVRQSALAIGVSGQQHGFVPVDDAGEVLAPVKLWCDTSTGSECDAITQAFGGAERCIAEVGNPILPGYTASKVRWLRDSHPNLYEKMATILLPHDYLNFVLTGERCMEAGDASGTAFFDVRQRQWSEGMLRAIDPDRDLRECLPEVRISNDAIGRLRSSLAAELGLPAYLPVSVGGGDNMMGAIGTGNVKAGSVTMSLGTSGTVYAFSDTPVTDPAGNIAAFCSSTGGWLPLLCTMNCTVSTELMRDLFDSSISGFESQIASANRGSDGVITVPFFNGERTPNLPNAKGVILGLDGLNVKRENLLRSAVEGATFALRFGIDELRKLGTSTAEIIATGGGSKSTTWRQIIADICDTPVVVPANEEGAAFGAALQALGVLEQEMDLEAIVEAHVSRDDSKSCEPRPSAVHFYRDVYDDYRSAVAHTAQLYSAGPTLRD
ncbi:MAG: xylulokinase [Pseudomonadota bacterium]